MLNVLRYPLGQAWRAFRYVDGAYLRGHPELELFPTVEDRRRAQRRVVSRFVWRRAFWSAVAKTAALAILLGLSVFALGAAFLRLYPVPIRVVLPWAVVPLVLVIVIAVFLANRWLGRHIPGLLRHELLDCGVPVCLPCGYPLFGLSGPNCPECGSPFDERAQRILNAAVDPQSAGAPTSAAKSPSA